MADLSSRADPRALWEAYRAACFTRSGILPVWVWAAKHDFDLGPAGLHLIEFPGARFDVGTHAMAIILADDSQPGVDQCHVVPLVRLTSASLAHLQPATKFDLVQRVQELIAEQVLAQALLDQAVDQALLWRMPVGGTHGSIQ